MTRDPVTPAMREAILRRDGECLAHKLDPDHVCRDSWGNPHSPYDLNRLTLEHVHDGYGRMGLRAKSDARHLVALCGATNVGVPSKVMREAFRQYLRLVNGEAA